jgi:hypothetical protein
MKLNIKNLYVGVMTLFLSGTNLFALETSDSNATTIKPVGETLQQSVEIVDQLSEYGGLISKSLYFIVVAMLIIYILHKLTSKFLYPHMEKTRVIKVIFCTLYALILIV